MNVWGWRPFFVNEKYPRNTNFDVGNIISMTCIFYYINNIRLSGVLYQFPLELDHTVFDVTEFFEGFLSLDFFIEIVQEKTKQVILSCVGCICDHINQFNN